MVTMLLGGLWHGASWTFVMWGGLHGIYLAIERFLRGMFPGARVARTVLFRVGLALLTYFLVNITWVFFRSPDFPTAWRMIRSMVGASSGGAVVLPVVYVAQVVIVITGILATHWFMRDRVLEDVVARTRWWIVGTVWAAMLFAIIVTQGSGNAFIYFQF